ncbi:MAG TPA: sigma factor, partial [Bacteroidota bacterium]|nr:sigma factor [Bacteroidota bacterium]
MPRHRTTKSTHTRTKQQISRPAQKRPPLSEPKSESRKEDAQLIHDALRGNQGAYKRLLRKYHDQIFHLISRIVHDRVQVEDLTQETFVK